MAVSIYKNLIPCSPVVLLSPQYIGGAAAEDVAAVDWELVHIVGEVATVIDSGTIPVEDEEWEDTMSNPNPNTILTNCQLRICEHGNPNASDALYWLTIAGESIGGGA